MFDYSEWRKSVKALRQWPMDADTADMFLRLTMAENTPAMPVMPEIAASFPYKVGLSRAEFLGFAPITWQAVTMIAHLSSGNPGMIVMYLSYLRKSYTCLNMNSITGAFPMGFPSDSEWQMVWDGQKDEKGKNGLDLLSAKDF